MPIVLDRADIATGAARFRIDHGRYKQRWYTDPLPTCPIAEASDWQGPAFSIVKKASGSDWTNTAIKRIANALLLDPRRFDGLEADEIKAAMRQINSDDLRRAGDRGTGVHLIAEDHLNGTTTVVNADAERYRASVDQFFADYKPTLYRTEFVCFNRTLHGHGYGGTADAILGIGRKRYLVDWKSRGDDSKHGAYPEEAAQLGAYSLAEYIVGDEDRRELLPELDGGLVVSIKPDGYRVYPVDLSAAQDHFRALHAWWVARLDERKPVGRQWTPIKHAEPEPKHADVKLAEEIGRWNQDLLSMLAAHWPEGVALPRSVREGRESWSPGDMVSIRQAMADTLPQLTADDITNPVPANPERFKTTVRPAPPATPPEDEPSDPVEVQAVLDAVASSNVRDVVNAWLHEAIAANMSWHPKVYPTVGNLARTRAAIDLAHTDNPRNVLARVLDDDAAMLPTVTVGTLIAALDLDTAHQITNPNTSKEDTK